MKSGTKFVNISKLRSFVCNLLKIDVSSTNVSSHLSNGPSDLNQDFNKTHFLAYFYMRPFMWCFVSSVSSILTGWNTLTANQRLKFYVF